MTDNFQKLIAKYRAKGILLDTNLLLLLFVGLVDSDWVNDFGRTKNQQFTKKEFLLLEGIVKTFSKIVTTPHILTETSNFAFQVDGKRQHSVLQVIAKSIQSFKERREESKKLVLADGFYNFGLTDAAILDLPPKRYLVLSVDAPLVIALQKKGVDAINFNHLRQHIWQQE
jgi:hypothetical protein